MNHKLAFCLVCAGSLSAIFCTVEFVLKGEIVAIFYAIISLAVAAAGLQELRK